MPYANFKGMKSIQIFSNFSKIFKKRAFGTPNAPKTHKWNFWKKNQNFRFFKNFICGFGCVLGAKSPFFENFRKVWKISNTFHTFTICIRHVLEEIFGLQIYQKTLKMGELGVFCREKWAIFSPLDVFEDICPRYVIHGKIFMWSKDLILVFKTPNGRVQYVHTNGTRAQNLKIFWKKWCFKGVSWQSASMGFFQSFWPKLTNVALCAVWVQTLKKTVLGA